MHIQMICIYSIKVFDLFLDSPFAFDFFFLSTFFQYIFWSYYYLTHVQLQKEKYNEEQSLGKNPLAAPVY